MARWALLAYYYFWGLAAAATLVKSSDSSSILESRVVEVQMDNDGVGEAVGLLDVTISKEHRVLDEESRPLLSSVTTEQEPKEEEEEEVAAGPSRTDPIVMVAVHRNGEAESCGMVHWSSIHGDDVLLGGGKGASSELDSSSKFGVEAYLTSYMADHLPTTNSCASNDNRTAAPLGFLGFCDMGPLRTVIQMDFNNLVRVPTGSLPCRYFTREGLRITSLEQIHDLVAMQQAEKDGCSSHQQDDGQQEQQQHDDVCSGGPVVVHLYAVPAGRMFMFAPSRIGETFELRHITGHKNQPISVTTLSLTPRLFDVHNFFSDDESDDLINKALAEKSEVFGFHRSTTGSGQAAVFSKRTSENAWDTVGETALRIKKRCFTVLGIDEYREAMADGLQILRYNRTAAYTPHMDYLDDRGGVDWYDYDTAGKGGNRFATILLYMNDLEGGSGGETVFPKAWPSDAGVHDRVPLKEAIKQLRASGEAAALRSGSWEEEMAAVCRTRLTVKPKKGRAVLFYSQFPNGVLDPKSYHGGCPVLNGIKYAANLWTWSAPRSEYPLAPRKKDTDSESEIRAAASPKQIQAIFRNRLQDSRFGSDTELYYGESTLFGKLGPNDQPIHVNTYEGHVWNVRVNGKTLRSFVIQPNIDFQEFDI